MTKWGVATFPSESSVGKTSESLPIAGGVAGSRAKAVKVCACVTDGRAAAHSEHVTCNSVQEIMHLYHSAVG